MGGRNQRFTQALSGFLRERDSPFFRIDGIYFLDHNTASEITTEMSERFKEFGISSRIRRIVPGTSHGNEQFLAAVYRLLDSAITHGFSRVLVISSLELLPYDLEGVLSNILGELENKAWSICFLGLDDDPSTGSPLESAKSGLLWIHHDGSNSLAGSMISSGSFLINLESDANWMRA